MPPRSFLVKVELTLEKISCPGVWLCSNGKVSLQVYMLDSSIQTNAHKPYFPVSLNEKFVFYKTFLKERGLVELQRSLARENFCAELVQWRNCDDGVVLASFRTTLENLLYSCLDLLMKPTKLFPGTIAPKLELRTRTTIEEVLQTGEGWKQSQSCSSPLIMRKCSSPKKLPPSHRRVCHTTAFSKAQQKLPKKDKQKPEFRYKRPEDDLILRLNPNKVLKEEVIKLKPQENSCACCYCADVKTPNLFPCLCDSDHSPIDCQICSTYEGTFTKPTYEEDITKYYCDYCKHNYSITRCPSENAISSNRLCLSRCSLAQKLHQKVMNTVQAGAVKLEGCMGDCEAWE